MINYECMFVACYVDADSGELGYHCKSLEIADRS